MTDIVRNPGDEERAVPGMLIAIAARILGMAVMTYETGEQGHRHCLSQHMVEHVEEYFDETMVEPTKVVAALASFGAQMLAIDPVTGQEVEPTYACYEQVIGQLKSISESLQDPFTIRLLAEVAEEELANLLNEQ